MKKAFVFLAIVGVLFFACDTNGDDDSPYIPPNGERLDAKAISSEFITYTMNENSTSKSVMSSMSRSLVVGNVYSFTIIKPKPQTSAGAANGFVDPETIEITVLNQESLGNGKIRYEVRRSDNNTTFKITYDANGMYSIQGLQGAKDGFLNPIGDNNNGLDGVYVGYTDMYPGYYDPYSFIINGNELWMMNYFREECKVVDCPECLEDPEHLNGVADNIFTFTIEGDEFHFDFVQKMRQPTGDWVIVNEDSGMIEKGTFIHEGNFLSITITKEWGTPPGDGIMDGFEFPSTRVPTN